MSTLGKKLHIDVPVKLTELTVAFSVPALAFEGDLRLLSSTFSSSRMTSPIGTPALR